MAARGASGDEPRGRAHRVRMDELRPGPAALGALRGEELHRSIRQRIKRKAQSWGRRYAALPVAERLNSRCWGR